MSLFDRLKGGFLEGLDTAESGIAAGGRYVAKEAVAVYRDPIGAAKEGGKWAYDQLLGDDIATLTSRDPKVTTFDKVLAGVSIASNFVGPEGKLLDKGLTMLAKEALHLGGEKLAEVAAKRLEETLGKDAFAALAKNADRMVKGFEKGLEVAEKVIDKLNVASGLKKSLTASFEDMKATVADIGSALKASPPDRAAAWAKVAVDLGRDALDAHQVFASGSKAKDAIHSPKPELLGALQKTAEGTLLQEARRIKAEGRTFIEGKDLVVDVRTKKDFRAKTGEMLTALRDDAKANGKHMVVFDPHISDAQARTLRAEGISVAKTSGDLTKISLAARAPGRLGIELLNLDARVANSEVFKALNDRKEKRETIEGAGALPAFVKSGPAEIGKLHEKAKSWDGKQATFGSISWARDGEVQQYSGRGWIKYEKSELAGDKPVEGHKVSIKPDPHHPGVAVVYDPLAHVQAHTQTLTAPDLVSR